MSYSSTVLATSGLVSYWRLGESAGPTATDANGVNNSTYNGALTFGTTGLLTGDADTAVTFPGAATAYVGKSGYILAGLTNWSIEFWLQRSAASVSFGAAVYCERAVVGNDILKVQIGQSSSSGTKINLVYRDDAGTLDSVNSLSDVTDNLRHHVVVTKSGTAVVVYIDGNSDNTGTLSATNTFTDASPEVRFGGDIADGPSSQAMVLDEVAVYNAALSGATVLDHYTAGTTAPAGITRTFTPIPFMGGH